MLFFTLLVSVEKAHVTFAATPEHIVCTTEGDSCVDSVLDLNCSASYYVKVGVGSSTVHVTAVTEYVGSTPKVLDACLSHLFLQVVGDFNHAGFVVGDVFAKVTDKVGIVETEIFDSELLHDFKTSISLLLCNCHGIAFVPGELLGAATELVAAFSAKCVPPCHGKLQPILHFLTEHYLLSIVVTIGERILAVLTFKLNFTDLGKILFCCHNRICLKSFF